MTSDWETITISLNVYERRFIGYLADRGNSVVMTKANFTENVNKALTSLKDKQIITIEPTIYIGEYQYKLTSIGINLVTLVRKTLVSG
jgi:hypothetical protein